MNDVILRVNETDISGKDVLSAIDGVLEKVRETNDLSFATNALSALKSMEKITGMAIAKLLSGLNGWWDDTNQDEVTNDTFEDWLNSVDSQYTPIYIDRCISVWQKQDSGVFSERMQERPLKDQQAIASHLDQGYPLSKAEMKKLERADSNAEVLSILRESKGKPPRKNYIQITLERDGSIQCWNEGEKYFVGYLNLQEAAEQEVIQKAINRIVKNAGISVK